MTTTSTNCSLKKQPIPSTPSTGSIKLPVADNVETLFDQLALVQGQIKSMLDFKEQLIDQLVEADENGLLDDYRNVSNDKQIVWEGMTLTQASKTTKTFADDVKKEIKRVEYEATRLGHFTKKTTEYWTLRIGAQ
jgi:hypothetical protein